MDTSILELGTRSFELFHANVASNGRLAVTRSAREQVALDASIDSTGTISQRAWADALRALGHLVARAKRSAGHGRIVAFAPHALGGADNAGAFIDSVHRRFGVSVVPLTPIDSARLIYRAARADFDVPRGGVVNLGDVAIDVAAGSGTRPEFVESLPLGIARLHRAYGATESGLDSGDAGALFSLVRLSAGPACRRLREWGQPALVFSSDGAAALRHVARAWGYLDPGATSLGRLELHALVPEVLESTTGALCEMGIEPARASVVGTTAVVLDALADLLGQRDVHISDCRISDGAALEVLLPSVGATSRPGAEPRGRHARVTVM